MQEQRQRGLANLRRTNLRAWLRALGPWLALLVLNALFVLPPVTRELPTKPHKLFMLGGELLVLVGICAIASRFRHGQWVRRGAVAVILVLWVYLWDERIGQIIVHQTPLLYDQLFLLRHVGVLITDLWSWPMFAGLLGAVVGLVGIVWGSYALLGYICRELSTRSVRQTVPIGLGVLGLLCALSFAPRERGGPTWAHWASVSLSKNLRASYGMYEEIERGLGASPYANYERDIVLTRKPDVQLFLVESYGRLLWNHPKTAKTWNPELEALEAELAKSGWHAVSGFSKAPVSGGRSWLAEATILTGISVRYEALFQHLVDDIDEIPNLVGFLKANGYEAMLLAPKDRARPGVEITNYYGYDRMVAHDDLKYAGRRIGWGEIPDQYSLGFAHENAFSQAKGPVFTNFHMVSSHAPWKVVPRLVDDWRTLSESGEEHLDVAAAEKEQGLGDFVLRMRRYRRQEPRFLYMGETNALKIGAYVRAIRYDLEVIADHLEDLQGDKLIIVMGDHQPPLIAEEDNSYDVPVHVFSRDEALLEEFVANGFVEGLALEGGQPTVIAHEGLFSLIVRNFARCCSKPGTPLPDVVYNGMRINSPSGW